MSAPRAVLQAIPGIDETVVDELLYHRGQLAMSTADDELDELWPLTAGIVSVDQMRAMAPFINMGGAVYRAQVLGYLDEAGQTSRTEVVIDASGTKPRLVRRQELTRLGGGTLLRQLVEASGPTQMQSALR